MHEGVRVDDFDGGRQVRDAGGRGALESLVRRKHEGGAQAFALAEQAVAHDFVRTRRRRQYVVDPGPGGREILS